MGVHDGVPAPACDQRPVDREGSDEGNGETTWEEDCTDHDGAGATCVYDDGAGSTCTVELDGDGAGQTRTIVLSTISMTAIESVSDASARPTAVAKAIPPRRSGTSVNE